MRIRWLIFLLLSAAAAWAQKYTGPRPPKPDVVYLVHADNLIPLESADARQESKKDEVTFTVAGASSPARTPLAEPIFMIQSEKIQADHLELYRMDVKGGRREVSISKARRRGGPRPLRLSVTKLDGNLYRVEATEVLENGEYSLSPNDSNAVFCFAVY